MNISTFSPALVLAFVVVLLCILMDIRVLEFSPARKWLFFGSLVGLGVFNHLLRMWLGTSTYGTLIALTLHLPTFLLFLYFTRCGGVKMAFMILSCMVFTAPAILTGNIVKRFTDAQVVLLLCNLLAYAAVLVLAQTVFREGFRYLLKNAGNRLFLLFSIFPLLYYIYVFCLMSADFSAMRPAVGYMIRLLPTLQMFVFYFLLPQIYKELFERRELQSSRMFLKQQLDSAQAQIALLNENQTQTAVYQHDMRHHLNMLDGLLATGKPELAQAYIKKVRSDVEEITTLRLCENELVNLICSSFAKKAKNMGVGLEVDANLPRTLTISDTELCSLLSNALENALHAAKDTRAPRRQVKLYCGIRRNNLLIEVRNHYAGQLVIRDGLPISPREDSGYGCRSIRAIAQRHQGHCSFEGKDGVFILRVVLPTE